MPGPLGRFSHHGDLDAKVEQLAQIQLFDNVPRRELELLAVHLEEIEVEAGKTLIHEGHRNDGFWILLEGDVDLSLEGGAQHHVLGPGSFFGVTSMLDGRPAIGTVTTATRVRAFVASADQFRAMRGNPTILLGLMSAALERLREDLEILRVRAAQR